MRSIFRLGNQMKPSIELEGQADLKEYTATSLMQ